MLAQAKAKGQKRRKDTQAGAVERGMGVVTYGSLGCGILTGTFDWSLTSEEMAALDKAIAENLG